ncbi:MAG: hypothetical protein IKZ96_01550 [Bacilli bacterium]|nr:hypothetical protein [Bacilli bacterium]
MEEISIKDIIFSFRHMYLENLEKLNKKLKKHISIDSRLIDDITMYFDNSKYNESSIKAKFRFKHRSFGRLICNISESLGKYSYLRYPAQIKRVAEDKYAATKGISVKDQKIAREIECLLKDEFYKLIKGSFYNKDYRINFTSYDITISSPRFIICYNCVGDVIYVYTPENITMKEILNTKIDTSIFDEYHKSNTKVIDRIVDTESLDDDPYNPGDYTIKQQENTITLIRLKKDSLSRYI